MAWSVTVGAVQTNDGSTHQTAKPAGVAVGDWLVLLLVREFGGALTTPNGWTMPVSVDSFASTTSCYAFIRQATGAGDDEPLISLVASSSNTSVMLAFTGLADSPLDVAGSTGLTSSATASTIDTPALTIAENGSAMVAVAVSRTETRTATWPASWTERVDQAGGTDRPHRMYAATRSVDAGSYAGESITLSGSDDRRCCVAIVLKPAADAGGGGTASMLMLLGVG